MSSKLWRAQNKQQNSVNPPHTGPGRCQIIECSGLSDSTYTDPSSYVFFFLTAYILGLDNKLEEYSIWISPSAGAGSSGSSPVFSGFFLAEEVDGCIDILGRLFEHVPELCLFH
jgi:hypothetical protein